MLKLVGKGSNGLGQDKLCGHSSFSAAGDRAARSAGRDITGRFITTCSHQLAVSMLNMPSKYGGERYAYAYIMAAGGPEARGVWVCGCLRGGGGGWQKEGVW